MRPRFPLSAFVVALVACWPIGLRAEQQAPVAGPGPKFTRQNVFTIPYVLEPATQPERQPVEVRLYVSVDEGKTWHLSSRATPTQSGFQFRARQDGRRGVG